MTKKIAIILVNYKNYALKYLPDCWVSLAAQDYAGGRKAFIVDNESTVESLALIKNIAPEAEVIINKNNDGFAKGNNDAIKLSLELGFDYIILFNMDTVLDPDCVSQLVEVAEKNIDFRLTAGQAGLRGNDKKEIGAVQARLMMYNDPSTSSGQVKINSLGNVTHFLGFGYCQGYGEEMKLPRRSAPRHDNYICYPSGAAVLFTKEALEKVGLFDEEFWMYNEDQDLGWRLWLAGYRCILAPKAVVYHKYEFSRSIKKYYYLDRNRIIVMLKNYSWPTLALVFPAFAVMEIGLIFFSLKNGWFYEKIKVYNYFLNLTNWRKIMAERKKVQKLRMVKDSQIVKMFSGKIWYQEIGETRLRIANIVFNAYWKIIRVLIKW